MKKKLHKLVDMEKYLQTDKFVILEFPNKDFNIKEFLNKFNSSIKSVNNKYYGKEAEIHLRTITINNFLEFIQK